MDVWIEEEIDKIVLVYCRSGNRSEKAAVKLVDNGLKNVKIKLSSRWIWL